ncbi:MAG TPA: hypothetical protein VE263_12875 [Candidatus Angelobacter sp.]|nr:hypothetical protein [Candidatus Angelobacter sp.]
MTRRIRDGRRRWHCRRGAESENGIAVGAIGECGAQGDAISFGGTVYRGRGRWKSDAVWREGTKENEKVEDRNWGRQTRKQNPETGKTGKSRSLTAIRKKRDWVRDDRLWSGRVGGLEWGGGRGREERLKVEGWKVESGGKEESGEGKERWKVERLKVRRLRAPNKRKAVPGT